MFAGSQKGCGNAKESYLKKGHSLVYQSLSYAFFEFARSYEEKNMWTVDSEQSQGISYLTERELNQNSHSWFLTLP